MRKKTSSADPAVTVLRTLPGASATPTSPAAPASVRIRVSGVPLDNFYEGIDISKGSPLHGLNFPSRKIIGLAITHHVVDIMIIDNEVCITSFSPDPFVAALNDYANHYLAQAS